MTSTNNVEQNVYRTMDNNIPPKLLTEYEVPEVIACLSKSVSGIKNGFCGVPIILIRTITI